MKECDIMDDRIFQLSGEKINESGEASGVNDVTINFDP